MGDNRGFDEHNPEMMVLIAIVGILLAVAIPRFWEVIRKSNESLTRERLDGFRSALSAFYKDKDTRFPNDPAVLLEEGKYLKKIPEARIPDYHPASDRVRIALRGDVLDDKGGWLYVGDPASPSFGQVFVNCSHTDAKGKAWSTY